MTEQTAIAHPSAAVVPAQRIPVWVMQTLLLITVQAIPGWFLKVVNDGQTQLQEAIGSLRTVVGKLSESVTTLAQQQAVTNEHMRALDKDVDRMQRTQGDAVGDWKRPRPPA